MEFKILEDEEVRYDIASYCTCNDAQKNLIWQNISQKQYNDTTVEERVRFEHTSRLVKAYIDSDEEQKKLLWQLYDNYTQLFCDRVKWRKMMAVKKNIKDYFKILIPNKEDEFYDTLVEKHYLNTNND